MMRIEYNRCILRLIPETGAEHLAIDNAIKHSVPNGWNTWSTNTKPDNTGERVWELEIETI